MVNWMELVPDGGNWRTRQVPWMSLTNFFEMISDATVTPPQAELVISLHGPLALKCQGHSEPTCELTTYMHHLVRNS